MEKPTTTMRFDFETVIEQVTTDENHFKTIESEYEEGISNEKVDATITWDIILTRGKEGIVEGLRFELNSLAVEWSWDYSKKITEADRDNPAEWSEEEDSHTENYSKKDLLDYKVSFIDEDCDMLKKGLIPMEIHIDNKRKEIEIYFNEFE